MPVDFPALTEAAPAWMQICLAEAAIAHAATYPSRAAEYGPGLRGVLEASGTVGVAGLGQAHIERDRFTGQVLRAFEDIDVLLVPVLATITPTAAEWAEVAKGDISDLLCYTAPFDLTGMPCLTRTTDAGQNRCRKSRL